MRAGSNACGRNWGKSCGGETRQRCGPRRRASRRPMRATPSICCSFVERSVREVAGLGGPGVGARCAATGAPSASAGADADAGEEPAAGGGAERRHGAQAGAVEQARAERFRALSLPLWTERRRQDNLELLSELERRSAPLDQAVAQEAARRPEVARWMTHPGVGRSRRWPSC